MAMHVPNRASTTVPRKMRGFTLIEVMVTVAIIAILAAIALPSYADYVRRGKIIDATSKLSDARVHLEQWFQDRRTYAGACVDPPAGVIPVTPQGNDYFALTCPLLSDTQYTVQAIGIPGKGMDNFGPYTINETNAKSSTITEPGWNGNLTCWATRRDGSCG